MQLSFKKIMCVIQQSHLRYNIPWRRRNRFWRRFRNTTNMLKIEMRTKPKKKQQITAIVVQMSNLFDLRNVTAFVLSPFPWIVGEATIDNGVNSCYIIEHLKTTKLPTNNTDFAEWRAHDFPFIFQNPFPSHLSSIGMTCCHKNKKTNDS